MTTTRKPAVNVRLDAIEEFMDDFAGGLDGLVNSIEEMPALLLETVEDTNEWLDEMVAELASVKSDLRVVAAALIFVMLVGFVFLVAFVVAFVNNV